MLYSLSPSPPPPAGAGTLSGEETADVEEWDLYHNFLATNWEDNKIAHSNKRERNHLSISSHLQLWERGISLAQDQQRF